MHRTPHLIVTKPHAFLFKHKTTRIITIATPYVVIVIVFFEMIAIALCVITKAVFSVQIKVFISAIVALKVFSPTIGGSLIMGL